MKIATFLLLVLCTHQRFEMVECLTVQRRSWASSLRHGDVRLWHGPKDSTFQVLDRK